MASPSNSAREHVQSKGTGRYFIYGNCNVPVACAKITRRTTGRPHYVFVVNNCSLKTNNRNMLKCMRVTNKALNKPLKITFIDEPLSKYFNKGELNVNLFMCGVFFRVLGRIKRFFRMLRSASGR